MYIAPKAVIDEWERANEPLPQSSRADDGEIVSTDAAALERTGVRSLAEGGIVTELQLDHDRLALRPTLKRVPDVTVEPEYWSSAGGRTYLFFRADGDGFEAFESALETDPTARDPVLVDRSPDGRVYRVELDDDVIAVTDKAAEIGGRILETRSCRDGWVFQLRLPGREALIEFNDYCRERDVGVQVNHIRTSEDEDEAVVGLTAKQQELLTVAYDEGYFDVPRGISQNELADRLGVSKSAVSQRLRRAIAELCATSLA